MKCLRCGLEITKWHPATPDDIDIHANRQDCIVELRAENARLRNELDEIRRAYTDIMNEPCEDEVHCTCVPGLRAEIVKWIAANNAATTIINEQQAEIECLRRMIQR